MFKIIKNEIKFNPKDFETEPDAIQDARDFANKVYYNEIADGSILYFKSWNFKAGTINFKLSK